MILALLQSALGTLKEIAADLNIPLAELEPADLARYQADSFSGPGDCFTNGRLRDKKPGAENEPRSNL